MDRPFPFFGSLALLGGIIVLALGALAVERNWLKLLRVAAAFACYSATLLVLAKSRGKLAAWWRFGLAGLAAGVVSGVVRPETTSLLVLVQSAGGIMLGTAHWVGAQLWWRIRAELAA